MFTLSAIHFECKIAWTIRLKLSCGHLSCHCYRLIFNGTKIEQSVSELWPNIHRYRVHSRMYLLTRIFNVVNGDGSFANDENWDRVHVDRRRMHTLISIYRANTSYFNHFVFYKQNPSQSSTSTLHTAQ